MQPGSADFVHRCCSSTVGRSPLYRLACRWQRNSSAMKRRFFTAEAQRSQRHADGGWVIGEEEENRNRSAAEPERSGDSQRQIAEQSILHIEANERGWTQIANGNARATATQRTRGQGKTKRRHGQNDRATEDAPRTRGRIETIRRHGEDLRATGFRAFAGAGTLERGKRHGQNDRATKTRQPREAR